MDNRQQNSHFPSQSSPLKGLLIIFIVYILLAFAFAGVYYLIYRWNPDTFSFNSDIVTVQRTRQVAAAKEELDIAFVQLKAADKLLSELKSKRPVVESKSAAGRIRSASLVTEDYIYLFRFETKTAKYRSFEVPVLRIQDIQGNTLAVYEGYGGYWWLTDDIQDYQGAIEDFIEKLEKKIDGYHMIINTPLTSPIGIWSYWDFLYFSVITLTTVGYGDILPNSTTVRMVVILEILLGSLLLIVFINLAASKKTDDRPKT